MVVATGVRPRIPAIPGVDHPKVVTYAELLSGGRQAGSRVAILGAGGIGFDVAEFLCRDATNPRRDTSNGDGFFDEWGVDPSLEGPGGLAGDPLAPRQNSRTIVMLQRKTSKPGENLGVSTGWILRNSLRKHNVAMLTGVGYQRIDDDGLHVTVGGQHRLIRADTIVVCTGQESNRALHEELQDLGVEAHLIGGAKKAEELDALRAIEEGMKLAQAL